MDIFKQTLAPMPKLAWDEINARAEAVIGAYLTTRKSLAVNGPLGLDTTAVSTGRLDVVSEAGNKQVKVGLYDLQPLLETRVSFQLPRWELDNVERGVKDLDLTALEEAVKAAVLFEENTIYNGNTAAKIKGLLPVAKQVMSLDTDPQSILESIAEAALKLRHAFAQKPYQMVVGKKVYGLLNRLYGNKLLKELVEKIIEGKVVLSETIEGALLLPAKHPDIEFTIGQDYTIGYEGHDEKTIRFFIMNSFTLRVLDPNILVKFDL